MITEDVDYVLRKGVRWFPYGRAYQLLHDVGQVPGGKTWDGMSFLPMRYNSRLMHGVLVHDHYFAKRETSVEWANRALLLVWEGDDVSEWFITATEWAFWWMAPTLDYTWRTKGMSWPQYAVAAVNLVFPPLARLIVNLTTESDHGHREEGKGQA